MSGDTSSVGGDRQKLSVVQYEHEKLTNDVLVDANDDQIVVGCQPRDELSVAIAATRNVAHGEIESALEDVAAEVRHLRAVGSHGFDEAEEVEPVEIHNAHERVGTSGLVSLAIDGADDPEVLYHLRQAAQLADVAERRVDR